MRLLGLPRGSFLFRLQVTTSVFKRICLKASRRTLKTHVNAPQRGVHAGEGREAAAASQSCDMKSKQRGVLNTSGGSRMMEQRA